MRRVIFGGIATVILPVALVACGSSGSKATAPTSSSSGAPTTSVTRAGGTTTSSPQTATSHAPAEISPSGDIPDSQAYVRFVSAAGGYSVEYPEGWARTEVPGVTTFADHFNSIRLETKKLPAAPTVATVRANEVPALQRATPGFQFGAVTSISRKAGSVVLVTYTADSAADPVTGKSIMLDVQRYEFWRNGTRVAITLSAPHGSDNVDPWKRVTDSFAWSA